MSKWLVLFIAALFVLLLTAPAMASSRRSCSDGEKVTGKTWYHQHCYTDNDTHADRETWGAGIKDELELCGRDEDSTPCPAHIDEIRIDSQWDFVRQEGEGMLALKHKANDLSGAVKKLISTLWVPNWFSKGEEL